MFDRCELGQGNTGKIVCAIGIDVARQFWEGIGTPTVFTGVLAGIIEIYSLRVFGIDKLIDAGHFVQPRG